MSRDIGMPGRLATRVLVNIRRPPQNKPLIYRTSALAGGKAPALHLLQIWSTHRLRMGLGRPERAKFNCILAAGKCSNSSRQFARHPIEYCDDPGTRHNPDYPQILSLYHLTWLCTILPPSKGKQSGETNDQRARHLNLQRYLAL
jgi:hypothetical protein